MTDTGRPVALRPRTVTDILDAAVGLYRHNFGTLLGIVAVVHAPLLGLQVLASGLWSWASVQTGTESASGVALAAALMGGMGVLGLVWVVTLVFGPLASGAVTLAVSDLYRGRPVTVGEAYRRARHWWGPLIGAQLLVQLVVGALAGVLGLTLFVGAAFLMAVTVPVGIALMVLAALLVLVGAVGTYLLLLATIPAIVVENRGVIEALGRSVRLVQPLWKHALGALALLGLLAAVPLLLAYALGFGAEFRAGTEALPLTGALASGLAALATLLVMPITLAGQVVIYYDLRVRLEGLDLEMMAAELEGQQSAAVGLPPPRPLLQTGAGLPQPPPPPPIVGKEGPPS